MITFPVIKCAVQFKDNDNSNSKILLNWFLKYSEEQKTRVRKRAEMRGILTLQDRSYCRMEIDMDIYKINDKFRIKVTDKCNFLCPFCHAEGGKSASDILVDTELEKALGMLKILYNNVHITGGEPLLYNNLEILINVLEDYGFNMAITTNGCFSLEQKWPILKKFQYINFSLHSLNEAYFSTLIGAGRNASIFLDLITNNIKELRQRMSVRINTVVGADENFQKVEDILDFAAKLNIELKLVPEWSVQVLAINNIMNLLSKKGFSLYEKIHLLPGSNIRERYKNAQGQIVEVKKIDFYWPDFLCKNCDKKIICQEGFSFLRIGGNPLYFQPCIFQNKLTPDEFQKNILPELIHIFREAKK